MAEPAEWRMEMPVQPRPPHEDNRIPVMYFPESHTIVHGPQGSHHLDLPSFPENNTNAQNSPWWAGNIAKGKLDWSSLGWWGSDDEPPQDITQQVCDKFGCVPNQGKLRFGNEQLQLGLDTSKPPKIIDTMRFDQDNHQQFIQTRRPWIYDPTTHSVYVGDWGNYHADTARYYGVPYDNTGAIRTFDYKEPTNSRIDHTVPKEVVDAISRYYGIGDNSDPEFKFGNILDPIHDTLAPEVWDNPGDPEPTFKPQHKKWLESQVIKILSEGGYDGVEDHILLVITGSITTYQYSERSDIDTSLFIDFDNFPEWSRAEMIGLFTEKLDDVPLPGTTYPLQIFVQPPEIKPEMIFKPGLRSGYILEKDQWLVPPDRTRVADIEKDMHDTYTYALECADKMDRLITYEPHKAVQYWHQLHNRRRSDQKAGKGDFAESNVAYKFIVNRGLTEELGNIMGKKIVL